MNEPNELLYCEPAKWERHSRGHTFGRLNLSEDQLWFIPDERISIVTTGFSVSLQEILKVTQSDNLFFRGAINIQLVHVLRIVIAFKIDPEGKVPGMEQGIFESDSLRLFLGSSRKRFLEVAHDMGLGTSK